MSDARRRETGSFAPRSQLKFRRRSLSRAARATGTAERETAIALLRGCKIKLREVAHVEWLFVFARAAFNVKRLVNLQARATE